MPTPGTGEIIFILMMVGIVFYGERVGALADRIGRAREKLLRKRG